MYDSDELLKKIGLPLDIKTNFRVFIIRLIVHYCWKLYKHSHNNFVLMIHDSHLLTRMFNNFVNGVNISAFHNFPNRINTWLNKIGKICDNIQKSVDLNATECILKVSDIVEPKLVFEKGDYQTYSIYLVVFCMFLIVAYTYTA